MSDKTIESMIAELEAERARLDVTIAVLRQRSGMAPADANGASNLVATSAPSAGPASGPASIRTDEFFQMSVPQAIKKFLGIAKQPQSARAITDALQKGGLITNAKDFYTSVFTALKRLRLAGDVVNVEGKGWGLVAWYRGRTGLTSKEPKNKKKGRPRPKKKAAPKAATKIAAEPAGQTADAGRSITGAPSPADTTLVPGYRAFLRAQLKSGESMADAARAWKRIKAERPET
jgi:hypothetical protein